MLPCLKSDTKQTSDGTEENEGVSNFKLRKQLLNFASDDQQ